MLLVRQHSPTLMYRQLHHTIGVNLGKRHQVKHSQNERAGIGRENKYTIVVNQRPLGRVLR